LNELHLSMEALGDAAVFGEEPHGDDFTHSNADVSLRRFAGLRVYGFTPKFGEGWVAGWGLIWVVGSGVYARAWPFAKA
jgi:hypothetical protein